MNINQKILKNISLALLLIILFSCTKENNNELIKKFEGEFKDSISKHKAEKFEYQYDGLVPQSSYLVNGKIKYLTFRHGPENGSIESMVFFDLSSDSIQKIIRRKISFEWDDINNLKTEKKTDTTYVILFNPKRKVLRYVGNKLVDSLFDKSLFENDRTFIYTMKKQTEKKYSSR
ncbi:hypothetical protein [Flavobacterium hydatis]|uniref:Lipoprotein n=1 Tax=Flavobacterium hydatis TaxID=991 RepID=A0A086AH95_FLAHY|nr:hypothetical protein [Flavobacterium hydatis]KFF16059.1 hypothetical protein IW20_11990 [Flavobacterium hydatis]OXA97597.1 hypothetical protein B0A62_01680 [Flavobacterium hydatis]